MKGIWEAAAAATTLAICAIGALALFQRQLIYFPDARVPDAARDGIPGVQATTVLTRDGLRLLAWYAPPPDARSPVVLYLHGNAGDIGDRAGRAARLSALGWGVLLLEYRGYGGNPGAPSERGLTEDARAALLALTGSGVGPGRVILWGESLGTALAVKLAAQSPVAAVLLEAPFTSVAALARRRLPGVLVDLLLRDRYDSLSQIGAVRAPLLVMAGGRDAIVPADMSRALFDRANGVKQFWLAPEAGHADLAAAGAIEAAATFVALNVVGSR